MEEITLKKNQEIRDIRMEPADNGGCVLRYTVYSPSMQHSDSSWDEKTEVYTDEEIETVALPRILDLYKADYANAMIKHAEKPVSPPLGAKG